MAIEQNPQNPNDRTPTNEELRRRAARLDSELQPDPELAEGPASGGRIAMFAIAIIAIMGVVFYGLNNSAMSPTGSTTAEQTTNPAPAAPATPAAPAQKNAQQNNMAPNAAPGQTTGAANPAPPAGVPQSPPAAGSPPANNIAPAPAPAPTPGGAAPSNR